MAFFQVNFFSPTLGFNTDINVFIPSPNSDEILNRKNRNIRKTESIRYCIFCTERMVIIRTGCG